MLETFGVKEGWFWG